MSPVEEQRQQEVEQQALAVVSKAKEFTVITTQDQYLAACEFGKNVAARIKAVSEFFEPMRVSAKAAYDSILAKKKSIIDPLEEAKRQMSAVIGAFEQEQERKRLEQQRLLEEEERKRREDEQLDFAAHLESQGRAEEAQQVLETEAAPVAVVVPREVPKANGVFGRTTYSAECVNLVELMKAVIENKVPASAVMANASYLDSRARSDKDLFNIPGCRLIKKAATTFRTGR